jgi:hypothetical protein
MYSVSFVVLALPSDDGQYWPKHASFYIKLLRLIDRATIFSPKLFTYNYFPPLVPHVHTSVHVSSESYLMTASIAQFVVYEYSSEW